MNGLLHFAHNGEVHESATEAAQHAANSGITITTATSFWLALLIIPIILLLVMNFLKFRLTTKLLIISVFLIIYSIASYQHPRIYSAVALSVGFSIVLAQSIVGLSGKEQ